MPIPLKQRKKPPWVATLRLGLQGQNGAGWTVREIRGQIQLSVRYENGQRSSIVLAMQWAGTSQAALLTTAAAIKELMAKGHSLRDAYELLNTGEELKEAGSISWTAITEKFQLKKLASGEIKERTWLRMYLPVVTQLNAVMTAKPRPTNGKQVLQVLINKYGGAPGSRGRQLRLQYASQLLRFGVDECAAEDRWLPPVSLADLVGRKAASKKATVPIKDYQVIRLLDGINNKQWRVAIGLMACFGLRGVELGYIQVKGPLLHCTYQKRTSRGNTKPRDIVGLDPVGLQGLSANLLAQLKENGIDALPLSCKRLETSGAAVRQYLNRTQIWLKLVEETAELNDQDLVPYSLRHGYALRAHEIYCHSPRVAAALMGHSLQTHSAVYGAWTDSEVIATALARTLAVASTNPAQ